MTEPLLALSKVTKTFSRGESELKAIDEVTLTIEQGEFVAIMGQSGSGKSTLMNILGCLDRPSSGEYKIFGKRVDSFDADALAQLRREMFGFVFQRYNLLTTLSAAGNVEMPAVYAGASREERRVRSLDLLQQLGLADRTDHLPSQLSGGQQQRVSIARALMNDPRIILADEPTGALDSKSGQEVLAILENLHQNGTTIILITHDEQVAAHSKRIIKLRDGKVIEDRRTTPEDQRGTRERLVPERAGLTIAESAREAAKMALQSLRVHLMRTFITLLGIVIGVAAVVIMLGVGTGSKESVLKQISSMGSNLLVVRPGAPGIRGGGDVATLSPADAQAIADLDNIVGVVPERSSRLTVRHSNIDYATQVQGVSETLVDVRQWEPAEGAFFTDRDVESYAPVAVVGQTVRNLLFPSGTSPLDEYILIGNVPFQIVGVMKPRGASPGGQDQDDIVLIPITTGLVRLFGKNYLTGITVGVHDVAAIEATDTAIYELLKTRHKTEDFNIRNMASILETAAETQNTLTVLLASVAAISLLVGGIGVMNIMLVSVVERTREIGVRMATGARMRDIMLQFNIESAVVCGLGGFVGLAIGYAVGGILILFGVEVVFTLWPAVLAFSCAFATGIIFGYLPARKAALLDPVVALAAE